jgi:hypothetical protein
MKSLAHLLGANALAVARDHQPTRAVPEPELLPIASTLETAAAWRRWAEAGRTTPAQAARPTSIATGHPAPTREPA